jgi:bifunctional non-homologous end joining protein LigD
MTGTGGIQVGRRPRVAYVKSGQLRLLSRNGRDMTSRYPDLAILARRARVPVILDGEIIAIRQGRPDFGALQSRMPSATRPPG